MCKKSILYLPGSSALRVTQNFHFLSLDSPTHNKRSQNKWLRTYLKMGETVFSTFGKWTFLCRLTLCVMYFSRFFFVKKCIQIDQSIRCRHEKVVDLETVKVRVLDIWPLVASINQKPRISKNSKLLKGSSPPTKLWWLTNSQIVRSEAKRSRGSEVKQGKRSEAGDAKRFYCLVSLHTLTLWISEWFIWQTGLDWQIWLIEMPNTTRFYDLQ